MATVKIFNFATLMICWDVRAPKPKNGPWVLEEGPQFHNNNNTSYQHSLCSLNWAVVRACECVCPLLKLYTLERCMCVCVQSSKNYRLWRCIEAGWMDINPSVQNTHTHTCPHNICKVCVCACMLSDHCVVVPHCDWASVIITALHTKNINFKQKFDLKLMIKNAPPKL